LPLLTYGLNVVPVSGSQLSKLNRKNFCMKPWESVKELQILCGRLDLKHLIDLTLSKMRLYDSVSTCPSDILHCCLLKALRSSIVKKMFYSYDVGT